MAETALPAEALQPLASTVPVERPDGGFGVYVHWPFCAAKCPYCDFNSHVRHGDIGEQRFLAAYLRELETLVARTDRATVDSIFFGGGTPSLMAPSTVAAIIDRISLLLPLSSDIEISLEANPGSVEAERFRGYRTAGVNRVSLGLQALNDRDLKFLGRIHSVAEARSALATATATFDRVSFDLIYARPHQQPAAWQVELAEALELGPSHLSLYQLTIEEGTPFHQLNLRGKLTPPPEAAASELYEVTQAVCEAAGLPAYEVSNHAMPGAECRHNLVYWRAGAYLGIGPGAHGRLSRGGRRIATVTERHPERWRDRVETTGDGLVEWTEISDRALADEVLIMGLRLREGIDLERLAKLAGRLPEPQRLQRLVELGLLSHDSGRHRIAATDSGRPLVNRLVLELSEALDRGTAA